MIEKDQRSKEKEKKVFVYEEKNQAAPRDSKMHLQLGSLALQNFSEP